MRSFIQIAEKDLTRPPRTPSARAIPPNVPNTLINHRKFIFYNRSELTHLVDELTINVRTFTPICMDVDQVLYREIPVHLL